LISKAPIRLDLVSDENLWVWWFWLENAISPIFADMAFFGHILLQGFSWPEMAHMTSPKVFYYTRWVQNGPRLSAHVELDISDASNATSGSKLKIGLRRKFRNFGAVLEPQNFGFPGLQKFWNRVLDVVWQHPRYLEGPPRPYLSSAHRIRSIQHV